MLIDRHHATLIDTDFAFNRINHSEREANNNSGLHDWHRTPYYTSAALTGAHIPPFYCGAAMQAGSRPSKFPRSVERGDFRREKIA
jgi:hypothetical protein